MFRSENAKSKPGGLDLDGKTEVQMGSERSFAWVFATVFLIIALFPVFFGGDVRIWSLLVAAGFLVAGIVRPEILRPLNRLWFKFGMLLNSIISPIVMGLIFFTTVTPIGLIRRLFNSDPIGQKIDHDADTYWIDLDPEKSNQSTMRQQF
ncbi:SxtJ family membrane protein [Ruegeria arenilitoris]|uniref:SxtJ family membrane protein n=1 Tax=Ruegeria arenilitoris TaxID=1173585 RepID=UPI00147CA505|nr:SxtJ family membrane protein [Ruegeria arenilitoris]